MWRSTRSNWPHCWWKIKWPAGLLMLTVMDGMPLYLIQPFTCPFYFLHTVLSACDVCAGGGKIADTQWSFSLLAEGQLWVCQDVSVIAGVCFFFFVLALPCCTDLNVGMIFRHYFLVFCKQCWASVSPLLRLVFRSVRLQQCHVWGSVAPLQRSALPDGDLEIEEAAETSPPEGLKALMHK